MQLTPAEWLGVLQRDYLRDFVGEGGGAVKFAVVRDEATRAGLARALHALAAGDGFLAVHVDAAHTRIHMVDALFHEIARQTDWDALARRFVERVLEENVHALPGADQPFQLRSIAARNDRDETMLRSDIARWLEKALLRDYRMSREFRLAMIRLCLAQLDDEVEGGTFLTRAVREWLRGELRLVSAVKEAGIFQKVARHNARHMLFSLTHWVRLNGHRGLVVTLDVSRYAAPPSARGEQPGLFYSTPATLDAYEVLRQCIDGADELEGGLLVVLAGEALADDEKRGLARYDALRLRVADEVRDRERQNPLAPLVRLDGPLPAEAA